MRITSSAVSLNVADERASAAFLRDHFGFSEEMSADGFVSLTRPDAGFTVIYLRTGLPTSSRRAWRVAGPMDCCWCSWSMTSMPRLIGWHGPAWTFTTPIETEPWRERYFQVTDPNGVVIQLVQWMTDVG